MSTTRPFHIGAQNDALFIISGQAPATTNDYPNHEADRTCVAKVFDEGESKRLVELANRVASDGCLSKVKKGEPAFTLLGRDPVAASLIRLWAAARERLESKPTPPDRIADARSIAAQAYAWCTQQGRNPVDVLDLLPLGTLTAAVARRGYRVNLVNTQVSEAQNGAGMPGMQLQGSSLKPADVPVPTPSRWADATPLQPRTRAG